MTTIAAIREMGLGLETVKHLVRWVHVLFILFLLFLIQIVIYSPSYYGSDGTGESVCAAVRDGGKQAA